MPVMPNGEERRLALTRKPVNHIELKKSGILSLLYAQKITDLKSKAKV